MSKDKTFLLSSFLYAQQQVIRLSSSCACRIKNLH